MKDFEIGKYLNRINLQNYDANLEGLKLLQQSHIQHIPFENLDVVASRKKKLRL